MASLRWLGLLVFLAASLPCSACPAGWYPSQMVQNQCFYYIHTEATFRDAQRACKMVKGMLVPPTDNSNTAALADFMQRLSTPKKSQVWVDMKRNEDGMWTTSNGTEAIPDSFWYAGYPEGDGECGTFLYGQIKVKNKKCSLKASTVCQGDKDTVQAVTHTCQGLPQTEAQGDVVPGTYGYLECDPGYRLSSKGHKKAFCRKDGSWSRSTDEFAQCYPDKCEPIRVGTNVLEITEGSTDVGSVRNFTCQQGEEFLHQPESKYATVKCTEKALWVDINETFVDSTDDCVPKVVDEVSDYNGASALSFLGSYLLTLTILMSLL